ncbi:polygalacturonase qrt3 [Phtheirospermum japonicum]|uniref:Polygalacturonase qrt3 n=1 Tax=Phtheirospermum japonicum TaxID=374723 RepID=A0A830CPG3_9LAMI|nr:polygalacturonase qrt3 [Phtheirospermum japonicum]
MGYGADPTGAHDSSAAILNALTDAAKVKTGLQLLPGISDLGGVVIDFQGGNFKISQPIRFPPGIGNIVVQGGTLRASDTFPGDRHLIELWATGSPKPSSSTKNAPANFSDMKDMNRDGMTYEDITFRDILFDSSFRGGGLLVINSARVHVADSFFLRFTTQGILVKWGHETFVSNCFLGQHPTDGGDPAEGSYAGIAIDIASTDNAVTDVVVFSADTGIVLRGNANILTGVHCYNKAMGFGGVGISVQSAQNRIISPYLDYNNIVIVDPDQVHVSNGFFYGNGSVVLKSNKGRVSGLTIVDNVFSGNAAPIVRIEGVFKSVDQAVVDRNVVNGMGLRSTVAKMAVAGINGTMWRADFSGVLLFPNKINHVGYAFYLRSGEGIESGFGEHAVTKVSNNVVVIESRKKAANAVVSVSVDQYNMVGEKSLDLM